MNKTKLDKEEQDIYSILSRGGMEASSESERESPKTPGVCPTDA